MTKKIYSVIFLFSIWIYIADAYTFTNTLSLGSTGQEVLELQKILNTNPVTQITNTGLGSKGFESTFFGQKTKDAVIKFQNLYAQDILYPNGLTSGTGIVSKSTREVLNKIQTIDTDTKSASSTQEIIDSISNILNQQAYATSTKNQNSAIFFLSTQAMQAGVDKKTNSIKGSRHILVDNKLYVGSIEKIHDVDFFLSGTKMKKDCEFGGKQSEYTCTLWTDKDTPAGIHKVTTNNKDWGFRNLKIIDQSIEAPKVTTNSLSLTKDNVIKGEHFTPHMTVYTLFGVFKTETKNNSFILRFPPEYVRFATTTTQGLFYLENNAGLKSNVKNIKYEI